MTGYDFHPEAALDLDEIWDFITDGSLDAADKLIADILASIDALVPFPYDFAPFALERLALLVADRRVSSRART